MDLKNLDLFKAFSPTELEQFRPHIEETNYKAGEKLFSEGDPGDCLYIISEGAIRIFKTSAVGGGEEKSLALLEAGTYLGEMTLLDGAPRSASARAEMDSVIIRMTRDGFMKLLRSYPQAGARLFASFMNALSQRLRQSNEELLVLYEVGKIIGAAPPLAELLRSILCHTMAGTAAQFGVFFYVNDITEMLEVKEAVGPGFEDILDLKTKVTDGLVGMALKKNEIIRVNDLETQPEFSGARRFGYERQRMMIAPLTREKHPFGAILIAEPCGPCPFTSANQNLLAAVASQAAAAVEVSLLKSDSETKEKFDRHFYRF